MRKSAKTCKGVLYVPLAPLDPQAGFAGTSCLRWSSACKTAVGISDQSADAAERVNVCIVALNVRQLTSSNNIRV